MNLSFLKLIWTQSSKLYFKSVEIYFVFVLYTRWYRKCGKMYRIWNDRYLSMLLEKRKYKIKNIIYKCKTPKISIITALYSNFFISTIIPNCNLPLLYIKTSVASPSTETGHPSIHTSLCFVTVLVEDWWIIRLSLHDCMIYSILHNSQ